MSSKLWTPAIRLKRKPNLLRRLLYLSLTILNLFKLPITFSFTTRSDEISLLDLLIIEKEYLDEESFVPIITDLFRRTQPIIRYRLDDVLVERKHPCPCGCNFLPLMRTEGRCDDLLYVRMPKNQEKPIFPDFISRKIVAASKKIAHFEVVQTDLSTWEIYLDYDAKAQVSQELHGLFKQLGCIPPKLLFVNKKRDQLQTAKRRRIRRDYAHT